ncbi:TlpA family protein disulfide reductase [Sphingobacterium sp. SGR-19]|uniref:TlpA family protein disulfide reductase n=1 Tax=Sphingobacterium sp. SGR-19 TaxID=2710886 RepID=UPI0013ED1F73|nr:TlpA disulfide reductase family protein [Sphingobacterium sp. SGR-19]NGM65792.1 TlpA family protein disulfide reductase [Sphingobacterium sp. SGR-19]
MQKLCNRERYCLFKSRYNRSRTLFSFAVAGFCFMLFNLSTAQAQSPENGEAAEGQTEIKPLQIGDTVPEELWNLPLQVINHPEGKDTITLDDYRDKKLIILDFWATWCGSCISTFPKISKIVEARRELVKVLPVSYEEMQKVERSFSSNKVIKNSGIEETIVEDSVLKAYFPHRIVPHYIWLDGNGRFLFQTDASSLTMENIDSVITENPVKLTAKRDSISFDKDLPFDANQFDVGRNLERTVFLTETPGIPSLMGQPRPLRSDNQFVRAYAVNTSIERLYELAFPDLIGIPRNRRKIDAEIDAKSLLCYEFIGKVERKGDVRLKIKEDIDGFLGVTSNLKREDVDCYTLQIDEELYRTREHLLLGERQTVSNWVRLVNNTPDNIPLICDFEPYKIFIPLLPIDASYAEASKTLKQYGIELKKDRRDIAVFYLKERRSEK